MKRFYKLVSSKKEGDGFVIELDGRPVKTPLKNTLVAPNEMLANALINEWSAQGDEIIPDSMPITQLLSTKIDKVESDRESLQKPLLNYLDTDLVCYFADHPPELRVSQEESWNPYLQWFETKFGCPLKTTTGLAAVKHDDAAHNAVREYVDKLSHDYFTILQMLVPLSGSIVLAMAFLEKQLNADDLFAAIRVEETFKADIYNEDFYGADPAQEGKDNAIKRDLKAAQEYRDALN